MNAKIAKRLRRESNYHPKQITEYENETRKNRYGMETIACTIVTPESHKGKYIASKKALRG